MRVNRPTLAGLVAAIIAVASALVAMPAHAQYFRRPVSTVDPRVMQIDEKNVLGSRITPGTRFVDHEGRPFVWGDKLGKPLILVLAYYSCDGSCSIINGNLRELLADVTAVRPGDDYRILTLSFDKHDNAEKTRDFRKSLNLDEALAKNWSFGTFASEDELKAETERIGFKFFWVPEDRVFLHPGAFLFFSPEGQLVRILYQQDISARDVELAVLDARQGNFRPNELVNWALSVCYSYNYADGKYRLSLPVFIGFGSFLLGIGTLFGSMAAYRSSRKHNLKLRENSHG